MSISSSLIVAAAFCAAFFALSYESVGYRAEQARDAIRTGFAQGQLVVDDYTFLNADIGNHQWNDCLLLFQAIRLQGGRSRLALSPLRAEGSKCAALKAEIESSYDGAPEAFYHNYMFGQTVLLRYLTPWFSIHQIRDVLKNSSYMLAWSAFLAGAVAVGLGRRRTEALVVASLAGAIVTFFGLEFYGQSLGHGPSDLIFIAFVFAVGLLSVTSGVHFRAALALSCVFGAFTMGFELLTGGLPLGLAAVVGLLPWALRTQSGRQLVAQTGWCAFGFVLTAALCGAIKLGLAAYVFGGSVLGEVASGAAVRTSSQLAGVPPGASLFAVAFWRLLKGMEFMTGGAKLVGPIVLACCSGLGAWGLWAGMSPDAAHDRKARILCLASSNTVILIWFAIFRQHAAEHYWMMARVLVWPIGSGLALFAVGCEVTAERRSRSIIATCAE